MFHNFLFIMEKTKNPSALSTRWEVWRFQRDSRHHIPSKHHNNLASFKGCDKQTLLHYLQSGHELRGNSVLTLAQTLDADFLPFLPAYAITPDMVQHFGAKTMLEKGVTLSSAHIRKLLLSGKANVIAQHIRQINFMDEDKLLLLQQNNEALTIAFLQTKPMLSEESTKVLLAYDDDVLATYFECCGQSDFVRREVIRSRSADVFQHLLAHSERNFTFDELKLLVKTGDLEKFDMYLSSSAICADSAAISLICKYASDAIFELCIKKADFSLLSVANCERLFEPKFRPVLLKNIHKHAAYSEDTEIKLIKSNDDELIKAYMAEKDQQLYNATVAWIFLNDLQDKYKVSVKELPRRHWLVESMVFSSGKAKLIEEYLFSEATISEGLTDFGEAQLILHAPINIIDRYLKENVLCDLAEKAVISRGEPTLFGLFFDVHHYSFEEENMVAFLTKADTATALRKLLELEETDCFLSEHPEVLVSLCSRKSDAVYEFILKHGSVLSQEEYVAFIKNAPTEFIRRLLNLNITFEEEAEAALLRHPDKELVKFYLENFELYSENEHYLLERLEPELIKVYDVDNFHDCDTSDYLI